MCAWLFIFSSRGHDRQSSDQNFSSRGHDRQSSEQSNRKLTSLHNNGEDGKHAHGFADSSCWEHISTCDMYEYLSKGTAVFQIEFSGKRFLYPKVV